MVVKRKKYSGKVISGLLTLSVILQSIFFTHQAHAVPSHTHDKMAYETIVICSGGIIQEITIDEDGNVVETEPKSIDSAHCPYCIISAVFALNLPAENISILPILSEEVWFDLYKFPLVRNLKPQQTRCLGPPSNV